MSKKITQKTEFENCAFTNCISSKADLTTAVFADCDLKKAVFARTNLERADLRTAFNFSLDSETNCIGKAKFPPQNIAGLLDKYNIVIEKQ